VKERLRKDTVILIKGSQNGVFAEEAAKQLLALPADSSKLVRQSRYWMRIKHKNLPKPQKEVKHVAPKPEHTEPPKQPINQNPQNPQQPTQTPPPVQASQPQNPPVNNSGE
jgi:hypothetical protein